MRCFDFMYWENENNLVFIRKMINFINIKALQGRHNSNEVFV